MTLRAPGKELRTIPLSELASQYKLVTVESQDPNYEKKKSFRAIALRELLLGELGNEAELQEAKLTLKASDGYEVEAKGALLLHRDAYLAVGESSDVEGEVSAFEKIGDRGAEAGPLYMIWRGDQYQDDKKFPRPWALVQITLEDGSDRYALTRPEEGFGENEAAQKGHTLFLKSCIRCHSINQQGGNVGPDLNVPQNILAYRPEPQVRQYIKNPRSFRYSSMPAHEFLKEQEMDSLISYLRLMGSTRKTRLPLLRGRRRMGASLEDLASRLEALPAALESTMSQSLPSMTEELTSVSRFDVVGVGASEAPARLLVGVLSEAGISARYVPVSSYLTPEFAGALAPGVWAHSLLSRSLPQRANRPESNGGLSRRCPRDGSLWG